MQMYFKKNSNGGYEISATLIVLLTFLILLLSSVASVVAYSTGVKGVLDEAVHDIEECKIAQADILPKVNQNTQDNAVTKSFMESIDKRLTTIESDVKEVLKNGD